MNFLITNTRWINPGDSASDTICSIRIREGTVVEWGADLIHSINEELIDGTNYCCSPGWLDLKANIGAPGRPQNESVDSLFNAAAAGGFTQMLISPNAKPIIQTLESVHYYTTLKNPQGIRIRVAAAASVNLEGKKMAEMLTLLQAGADAFSFVHPVSNSSFLSQVLLYTSDTGKPVIHFPQDTDLSSFGQINEGEVSDRRGLTGIPAIAETIFLNRDISLLGYSGGKLHFSSLSVGSSPGLVSKSKASGLSVSCDVAAHQLAFTDENLDNFDTLSKVMPPYRTEADRQELINALLNDQIDAVVSDHSPWHYDFKDCEFYRAEFGISSLETTFACLNTFAKGISPNQIVQVLAIGPRQILGLDLPKLHVGMKAEFTLFSTTKTWIPMRNNWQSKSFNNPFFEHVLTGIVAGIITETGFSPNPHNQ